MSRRNLTLKLAPEQGRIAPKGGIKMAYTVTEIARAMYSKEKDSLDQGVVQDIRMWADECSLMGMGTSSILLNGVWEREEQRVRKLCRYFWETLMDLIIKQKGTVGAKDIETIRAAGQEILDIEVGQAKDTMLHWISRTMRDQEPHYLQKIEEAKKNFIKDLERELTIRRGMLELGGVKTSPAEIPRSTLIEKDFSFISSGDLRQICERDYEEIQRVQIAGAHKATVVMSGSLTEAVLLNALLSDEPKAKASSKSASKPLEKWDLHELLEVAIDIGLVNPGASVLVKAIKDYRNLIHPGKEVRSKFVVGAEEAAISRQFLDLVIRDLGQSKSQP